MTADSDDDRRHGPWTDPGPHGALFDALPDDAARLCAVVQGLLLHDHYGGLLYGMPPPAFAAASRVTLPVAERLDRVLRRDAAPLAIARAPFAREVGTCRDFALLLCAMLRHKGHEARVRCGFATYFGGAYEDHWVCEHRRPGESRRRLADAQLDEAHREYLGVGFDITDVPRDRFLVAPEAWAHCRDGADPADFGNWEARGLWFLEVNLARDALACRGRVTSDWDRWREAPEAWRSDEDDRVGRCRALADRHARGAPGADAAIPDPP